MRRFVLVTMEPWRESVEAPQWRWLAGSYGDLIPRSVWELDVMKNRRWMVSVDSVRGSSEAEVQD